MKQGTKGIMTWGDGSTSRVFIASIHDYPATGMPSDYMFDYESDETHRPLVHPELGTPFPIPEGLVSRIFTPNGQQTTVATPVNPVQDTFTTRMNAYIEANFAEADQPQARKLFAKMERLGGRQRIIDQYLSVEQE